MNPSKDDRKTIRVVLAEDQGMVLGALAALLEIEGDITVVAQCRDGSEALKSVLAQKPDVLITDIEMPKMTGLEVAGELKRRRIATRRRSAPPSRGPAISAAHWMRARPAICLRTCARKNWRRPVHRVQQGLRVIDPESATEAWADPDPLTDRERQVLRMAGDGQASGDIAAELNLSEGTVRNYLSEAISKSWARAIALRRRGLRELADGYKGADVPAAASSSYTTLALLRCPRI